MTDPDLPFDVNRLSTTPAGADRIRRNLLLDRSVDPLDYCRKSILEERASISRRGKNWYVISKGAIITINASSLTIITAHKKREL
ncbi:MAG: DUF3781 domain-containing protein [Muribaculaceae bacterium]|nr:DUF3781 domain-containing protein [Muribaculaceae bacterium]